MARGRGHVSIGRGTKGFETAELQARIDAAGAAGGGRVVVGWGVHRTGALRLRSHVELHVEAGAVLQFVPDPALYPPVEARWEGAGGSGAQGAGAAVRRRALGPRSGCASAPGS